jgi:hypothetical protein
MVAGFEELFDKTFESRSIRELDEEGAKNAI